MRTSKPRALLFVYGTLRPCMNIGMARWLRSEAEHVGAARVRGRLYDLGAYPGLVDAHRSDEWVVGDLYRLPNTARMLRVLDRYEGAPDWRSKPSFVRVERCVFVDERTRMPAWLYVYRGPIARRARIRSGDYRAYVAARKVGLEANTL